MTRHAFLAGLLLAGAPALGQLPPSGFAVGEPFPGLVLPDLDGTPRSIADFRGGKVVLHVFASW